MSVTRGLVSVAGPERAHVHGRLFGKNHFIHGAANSLKSWHRRVR